MTSKKSSAFKVSVTSNDEPRKVHELKIVDPHFAAVCNGTKTFELRVNDRDFQVGEFLFLRHYEEISWSPYDVEEGRYLEGWALCLITYVLKATDCRAGMPSDLVILATRLVVTDDGYRLPSEFTRPTNIHIQIEEVTS